MCFFIYVDFHIYESERQAKTETDKIYQAASL